MGGSRSGRENSLLVALAGYGENRWVKWVLIILVQRGLQEAGNERREGESSTLRASQLTTTKTEIDYHPQGYSLLPVTTARYPHAHTDEERRRLLDVFARS